MRSLVHQWGATRVHERVAAYSEWLTETDIPKLCLYAEPGVLNRERDREYIEHTFAITKMVNLGDGLDYLQEDHPPP